MRTRTTPDTGSTIDVMGTHDEYHWTPGWVMAYPNITDHRGLIQDSGGVDTIVDDPGKGRGVKSVLHLKYHWRYNHAGTMDYWTYNTTTGHIDLGTTKVSRYSNSVYLEQYGAWKLPGLADLKVSYPKDDESLVRETVHKFFNTNEVDNLTNILDASHTLPEARLFRGKLSLLKLSNGYLYYSFGVAPLLADLKSMANSVLSLKKDCDRAVRLAGKIRSVHGRMIPSITVDYTNLPNYGPSGDGVSVWYPVIYPKSQSCRICSIRGRTSVQYNNEIFSRLSYYIDRFLSAGPASALWEKIPYSFVLDWFVNLSGVIDHLDNVLTGANKHIIDASLSEKYDLLVAVFGQLRSGEYNTRDGQNMANADIAYYRRDPLDPTTTVGPSRRFGKKQGSLLAALIHQIVANLKSKR